MESYLKLQIMHLYDEAQKIFSDLYVTTVGVMLFQSISILLTLILKSSGFACTSMLKCR